MNSTITKPYRPKIYIHAPYEPEPAQAEVKQGILNKIRALGFDPQEFQVSGIPRGDAWDFDRAIKVMRQCDGALILALMRWISVDGTDRTPVPSEYSHFEGALALSCKLPTLVIAEKDMQMRGILLPAGGRFVLKVPMNASAKWLAEFSHAPAFEEWTAKVNARHDVFFGYCSKADQVAGNIKKFLTEEAGMSVLDWATDFVVGRTIMEEVARATATCRCGLFLFTADDPIAEDDPRVRKEEAVPRDNVLLEAGYFMSAHTARRMVVVRENGTKMPADLGGMIYLALNRRNQWKAVAEKVASTLRTQISNDIYT